jgi:hypothetical protein
VRNIDLNHTFYRIANEPMRTWPFLHFFVREVFTPEVYRQLHENWPAPEHFQDYVKAGNIEKERFYFPFEPENVRKLPPEQRIFWEGVHNWLISPALQAMSLGKYGAAMDARLMEAFEEPVHLQDIASCLRFGKSLVWDIPGYGLLPHADDPRVLFNFLFYLPRPEEASAYGTSIYLPKQEGFYSRGESRHPREDFDHVFTFPFEPNAMFSFMRTPFSFHGVEPLRGEGDQRRLMLYSIRLDNDAVAQWRQQRQGASVPVLEPAE